MSATLNPPGGAPPPPPGPAAPPDDTDQGGEENVVATVVLNADGTWTIYSGDEPEEGGEGDMSEEDVGARGAAGEAPAPGGGEAPQGQTADSLGAAMKIVMSLMQDAEAGPGAGVNDSFSAGFNAPKEPTPAGAGAQKYP